MPISLIKLASVILAWGFAGIVAALIRRRFAGWASDSALGKGAALSLLCIAIALMLALPASIFGLAVKPEHKIWFEAFISAAFCEEFARLIVLFILLRGRITDDPREFIVGAAGIGLGFGIIENLMYLAGTDQYLALGALRGVMSAPAHLSFSMLTAYGLWSASQRGKSLGFALFFFLLAVGLHGFFDVTLMAWPETTSALAAFLSWKMLAIGLGIIAAVILTAIATLLVLTEFIDWSEHQASHDLGAASSIGTNWAKFSQALCYVAGAGALAPLGMALGVSAATAVAYTPMLLGSAASLALWSMAIWQLAN